MIHSAGPVLAPIRVFSFHGNGLVSLVTAEADLLSWVADFPSKFFDRPPLNVSSGGGRSTLSPLTPGQSVDLSRHLAIDAAAERTRPLVTEGETGRVHDAS